MVGVSEQVSRLGKPLAQVVVVDLRLVVLVPTEDFRLEFSFFRLMDGIQISSHTFLLVVRKHGGRHGGTTSAAAAIVYVRRVGAAHRHEIGGRLPTKHATAW